MAAVRGSAAGELPELRFVDPPLDQGENRAPRQIRLGRHHHFERAGVGQVKLVAGIGPELGVGKQHGRVS